VKETEVRQAPILAMKNKDRIAESNRCGCYHCLKTCSAEEITEWTDGSETALCPHCSVDALIPDQSGVSLKAESLEAMRRYWFQSPPDGSAKLSKHRPK
jgi:hypothetical protein